MKKETKQDLMQQLAEAYNSLQALDITATANNISALEKTMGLMRYVYGALENIPDIPEEATEEV